ncbi:TPA: hypothetical protein KNN84_000769 [Clostridioides difficile]|nr:hypothetical protein [Clostridioides difficile]
MLSINGVDIIAPTVFQVDLTDIDGESNRNAKGEMCRDRIATKRKLNCEWGILDSSEISILLNQVKDVFFKITYPDPILGHIETKTFYVGDRSMPVALKKDNNIFWQSLKMNFIEK